MKAKEKTTAKSLAVALLGILLSCAMLFGATYAWFSDSVTTVNIIKSADFDVTLEYADTYNGGYRTLTNTSVLFDKTLSPGEKTDVRYIKITNNNAYPIKASVAIGAVETPGGGNQFVLYTAKGDQGVGVNGDVNFNEASDKTTVTALTANISLLENEEIASGESYVVAIAVGLPLEATTPNVTTRFVITVSATQATAV